MARRVLRPAGRFSIDLLNPGPAIRHLEPRTERVAGGFHVLETRSYDAARQRIEKRVTLSREAGDEVKHYFESVRLYTPDEIRGVLARAGLQVCRILGDFTGRPYEVDTPRMILLGRKGMS